MDFTLKRLKRELENFRRLDEEIRKTIHIEPVDGNLYELKAEIAGPADTPYEGARFQLEIKIPQNYPCSPPDIRFVTKIWHPNFSSTTGATFLSIPGEWTPAFDFGLILIYLQSFLSSPNSNEALLDSNAAEQFKKNPDLFRRTAQHWAHVYAGGPIRNRKFDKKIGKLMDMLGMSECDARLYLSVNDWNLDQAADRFYETRPIQE